MASKDERLIRVGVDVGGTFTKAVALDNATHEILGKASVMTSHQDEMGVAAGVIEAFQKCLDENDLPGSSVVFIAHSTTQATNALLEGDVSKVGVIGIGQPGLDGFITKRQARVADIDLGTGKKISVVNTYRSTKGFDAAVAKGAIDELLGQGAKVIVACKSFGVDDSTEEKIIEQVAESLAVPVTLASDITKMYGLAVRAQTAVVNASILPKMIETSKQIEESVKKAGISAPLMMMRGDGGVMEIQEMEKKPILTMLSGPAASVMGALMYLRASNGIYFEVGGTSTNIGVIKDGRPAIKYATIGGHRTYVNSLDVRVLGVAGGSMIRTDGKQIVDVGPRSAHIAGLPYVAFTPPEQIVNPKVELVRPKPDDPGDYVAIRCENGALLALTNTCAANVLGVVKPEYFSYANQESCRKGMQPLADLLGLSLEETARAILTVSSGKIVTVIESLSAEYKLETDQSVLVGCGGGAGSLLPFTAERMKLAYSIPENAEVISSIGVALAMIREVVERVVPSPKTEDIRRIRKEAAQLVIDNGATPESVEVHIEIDTQAQKVTAIATGSNEVQTTDLETQVDADEACRIATQSFGAKRTNEAVVLAAENGAMFVFTCDIHGKNMIRVVDRRGFIRIQRRDGFARYSTVGKVLADTAEIWEQASVIGDQIVIPPSLYILRGGRILDLTGALYIDNVQDIIRAEIEDDAPDETVIIVVARNDDN